MALLSCDISINNFKLFLQDILIIIKIGKLNIKSYIVS